MSVTHIIILIMSLAPHYGIDPKVALAVAEVESRYNAKAIGGAGEIGLFQIHPTVAKKLGYTKKQLLRPATNIRVGLRMLRDAKATCIYRGGLTYLVCYNYGRANAKKIKHPNSFPYVRKVREKIQRLKHEEYT